MVQTIDFETGSAEIATKEEAFWIKKRELSEKIIEELNKDLEEIPMLIEFHKAIVKMCKDNENSI